MSEMTDDDVRAAIAENLPLCWVPGAIREPCGRKEIVGQPVWDAVREFWRFDFFDPSSGKMGSAAADCFEIEVALSRPKRRHFDARRIDADWQPAW
jgi:hypothetical protein